jgi:hypothetical protein
MRESSKSDHKVLSAGSGRILILHSDAGIVKGAFYDLNLRQGDCIINIALAFNVNPPPAPPNLGRGERKERVLAGPGSPKHAEKPFLVMEKQCTRVLRKQSFGNAIALNLR